MATVLLSALLNGIQGKLNGSVFRRNRGTVILQRLGARTTNFLTTQNSVYPVVNNVFRAWGEQTDAHRRRWKDIATTLPFPDKWGFPKYLTGRQLFTKCNIFSLMGNAGMVDIDTFDTSIPGIEVSEIILDLAGNSLNIVDLHLGGYVWAEIHVKRQMSEWNVPDPNRVKFRFVIDESSNDPSANYIKLVNSGVNVVQGQLYYFTLRAVSTSGLPSAYITFLVYCV